MNGKMNVVLVLIAAVALMLGCGEKPAPKGAEQAAPSGEPPAVVSEALAASGTDAVTQEGEVEDDDADDEDDAEDADDDAEDEDGEENEEEIPLDQVPQVVKDAALKVVEGITLTEAEKETEDSGVVYEIEGTAGGKEYVIEVAADGKVLEVEEEDADDDDDADADDDDDDDAAEDDDD